MSLLCGRTGSHVQVVDESVVLPEFPLVEKIVAFPDVDDIRVVARMRLPMVLQTVEIPQLHVDMVIDFPGVRVQRVSRVLSWRRQSSSHGCTR